MELTDIAYLETHKKLRTPVEELIKYHDTHKRFLTGVVAQKMGYPWLAYKPIDNGYWKPHFAERFPQFVEDVAELPFKSILRISFLESYEIVSIHQDMSRGDSNYEPCAYRAFLCNNESFYIAPCPQELRDGKSKVYHDDTLADLPKYFPNCESGRWWLMNNENSMHGTVPAAKGSKKIIVSIWGQVDPEEHKKFVMASLNINKPVHWDNESPE